MAWWPGLSNSTTPGCTCFKNQTHCCKLWAVACWRLHLGMKTLSVLGTAAMFLVGGGILLHGVPALGHAVEHWAQGMAWAGPLLSNLAGGVAGLVAGAVAVGLLQLLNKIRAKA